MTLKPNFFLVGAPRCGTTSLWAYLKQHPDIYMCDKEPHAFGRDLGSNGTGRFEVFRDLDRYLALFADAGAAKLRGDASPFYLYSESAAAEIQQFEPEAKILVALRNPVDAVHSIHLKQVFNFNEDLADLGEALDAEPERAQGRRLPPLCSNPTGLRYGWLGKYSPHVRRYLDVFGPQNVHILWFDDLRTRPRETLAAIFAFLGLPDHDGIDFRVHNPSAHPRSLGIHATLGRLWSAAGSSYGRPTPAKVVATYALQPLFALNTMGAKPPPCSPEVRRRLAAEFASDVEALGQLTGRDLSSWTG